MLGLVIGIITAFVQFSLLRRVVNNFTSDQGKKHRMVAIVIGRYLLWVAVLIGVALISFYEMLWAAGAMLITTFALILYSHFYEKKER